MDDINEAVYNFYNMDIVFPVILQGTVDTGSTSSASKNGPNVGGSSLQNGTYRVPIMITFKSTDSL